MPAVRSTTSPPLPPESRERPRPGAAPALPPVHLERQIEADRRRSLQEELNAAEERLPQDTTTPPQAEMREVVAGIGRMGSEAVHLLRPVDIRLQRLAEAGHIDEQA